MTHEQKMLQTFPDYPCARCKRGDKSSCVYKECIRFDEWFTKHWNDIREAGRLIQERNRQIDEMNANRKFNWEDFSNGNIAVAFESTEKLEVFLLECEIHNLGWGLGESAKSTAVSMVDKRGTEVAIEYTPVKTV